MGVPHPISYQGSKRAFANSIIAYFPRDADKLIEPFAGSAAVTLAVAYYGKVKTFFISDINQALVNVWDEILHRPHALARAYEELWRAQLGQERVFYDRVRTQFNQTQRADYFLYLLARCVKASVRYNPEGEFNQSPDNRRNGTRPTTMRARILGASRLLGGRTELACVDYTIALARATSLDIVYMDPPYQGVCEGKDKRYIRSQTFEVDSFLDILLSLNHRGISFILSYDGRTGEKRFGRPLPESLRLMRLEIEVGKSAQATLLGRNATTVESLYLSPALCDRIGELPPLELRRYRYQYPLALPSYG